MDPLSERSPFARRPRSRLDLACRRNPTPASPQESRPPPLTLPIAGDDMSVSAVSLAAWLEALAGESIAQKFPGNRCRLATVRYPACSAVRVRYGGVLSHGGDSDVPGRAIRVALRGLRQAAFGAASPRAAQVGLQGVPEQALAAPWRRCPAGAEPLPDGTAANGPEAGGPGRRHRRPGTALLSLPAPGPACRRKGLAHCRQPSLRRPASSRQSGPAMERLAGYGPSGPRRKPNGPQPLSSRYRLGRERNGVRSGSVSQDWSDRPPCRR